MGTIGELIGRHHSEIIRLWTEGAKGAAFARGLSPEELTNRMPEYLSLLGQAGPEAARPTDAQQQVLEHHVSNRLRQGFVLNEILTEFALLGRCASRFIEGQAALGGPTVTGLAGLFSELTLASVAVTKVFNEHMLEDEQTEKRCARMVQRIAADAAAIRTDSGPWRTCLREILGLIMQAMGAHTAALYLFDIENGQLIMSASTGDAVEQLEQHVSAVDASTFAGKIASGAGGSSQMSDAETTELGVSEALRRSGIHSLLGVRLSARHLLRGVIYVGIRQQRTFSASESRRLEGLGATLAVQLDNAQLIATLRGKIEALEAEG